MRGIREHIVWIVGAGIALALLALGAIMPPPDGMPRIVGFVGPLAFVGLGVAGGAAYRAFGPQLERRWRRFRRARRRKASNRRPPQFFRSYAGPSEMSLTQREKASSQDPLANAG